jgi:hypothetical protein
VTKLVLEVLLRNTNLSDDFKSIARIVLLEQELTYPKKYTVALEKLLKERGVNYGVTSSIAKFKSLTIKQLNGQLMGSILSFPILCIVNLLIYWLTLEQFTGLSFSAEQLPVRVNGDDILFRATPEMYAIWQSKLPIAGFKLSVGKNYIHPSIFTINSQCFTMKCRPYAGPRTPLSGIDFQETLYMNVGLLIGSPDQTKDRTNTIKPINEIYNLVVGRSSFPERAHRRFLHYHKDTIAAITTETHVHGKRAIPGFYNLFLPLTLGGLGFTNFHDKEADPVRYNSDQAAMAHYLRHLRAKFLSPVVVPPSAVRKADNATRFVLAVAPPMTYPQRFRSSVDVVLADPRQPLDSGEVHLLPDLKAPPLFESGDVAEVISYTVKHPRKSVIRQALRSFTTRRQTFSASNFGIADEDSYTFRYRVNPSIRTEVKGAFVASGYATSRFSEIDPWSLSESDVV